MARESDRPDDSTMRLPDELAARTTGDPDPTAAFDDPEPAGTLPMLPGAGIPTDHAHPATEPFGADPTRTLKPQPDSSETQLTPAHDPSAVSARPSERGSLGSWGTLRSDGQLVPGQVVFGRFDVIRKLGGGGMGEVWLVRHRELNAERALKLILARVATDDDMRARFRREAQAMARFAHPNAVVVHDARLTESDVAYIEMEFVEGQSLDKVLKGAGPRPLAWVARIADQLCDVLQVAHERQIVHRDLKPSNLMLVAGRPEGREQIKVLDFGIAKILDADEGDGEFRTITGFFIGTPPYASPEQVDGRADARSDVYSVGVILYEMLAGCRPFKGSPAQLIGQTLGTPPAPFATTAPDASIPPEVEAIVLRCLEKEPDKRPQSARELAEALRAAIPHVEVAPPPPPPPPPPDLRPILLALALLLALAVGAFLWRRPPTGGGSGGLTSSTADNGAGGTKPPPVKPNIPGDFEVAPGVAVVAGRPPAEIVSKRGLGRFVWIEGGTFEFGPPDARQPATVPGLYVQATEVTNGQAAAYFAQKKQSPPAEFTEAFEALVKKHGLSQGDASLHPAVNLDHAEAEAIATWAGGRLPTEAEWEYAARSGGMPGRKLVWADATELKPQGGLANVDTPNNAIPTVIIGWFPKDRTDQGVFDLMGNVREWCRDKVDLPGTETAVYAVRGGSFNSLADLFATWAGEALPGKERLKDLGLRVVIEWPAGAGSTSR